MKTTHYTKAELKILKDMTLSDEAVATLVNRTKQAVYSKRWSMRLVGPRKKVKSQPETVVSDNIIQQVVEQTTNTSIERVVLGNVTIDLVSKTLTIKF